MFKRLKKSIAKRIWLLKSLFYKRNNKIVLIGSWMGEKFADNSRYLFQYLHENKEELGLQNVVWVTRKKDICDMLNAMGYEAYMMESEQSIFYHKTAGIHIICNSQYDTEVAYGDIMGKYSYGAKCVDLWHGLGLKGVGYATNDYKERKVKKTIIKRLKEIFQGGWGNRWILSTTSHATDVFEQYFRLPRKNFIESAYPRNCIVPKLTFTEMKVVETVNDYEAVVLYLPTFRSGTSFDFLKYAEELSDILKTNNILWIQKSHSVDCFNHTINAKKENILNLEPEFDINVLLPHITLLVTDYSSVMFDAMYHNKPVLYFIPDYDEYRNGDRGFVINPEDVMCGPKFFTLDELKKKLPTYCKKTELAKESHYNVVREKYWGNEFKELKDIWNDISVAIGVSRK